MIFEQTKDQASEDYPDRSAEIWQRRTRCEELEREITTVAGHINAINYHFIKLLSDFDEDKGWEGEGIASFAHWLNWKCGIGQLAAREKVRVARALRDLPEIDESFKRGEISYSKVRAITRVANARNESALLFIARSGTAQHVEQAVARYKRCRVNDEIDDMNAWKQVKGLSYFQEEGSGMYIFSARLPAEEGELMVKAINRMVDEVKADEHATENSGEESSPDEKNGENVSAGTFLSFESKRDFMTDRASAFVAIAEHYLSSDPAGGARTLPNPDKYQIVLHINANDAHLDAKVNDEPCCYLEEGKFLAPHVARQLACDAGASTILEDDSGNILSVGRRTRVLTRAIRLALQIRDGGCRFPNCHARKWTDAHHIIHWADGGETSLGNLVTLCRYHHTLVHKGDFSIVKAGNDLLFINRKGETLRRAFVPQFPACPDPDDALAIIGQRHEQQGIAISELTAQPDWLGNRPDYDETLMWLCSLDSVPAGGP